MPVKTILTLENGTHFIGESFGAEAAVRAIRSKKKVEVTSLQDYF